MRKMELQGSLLGAIKKDAGVLSLFAFLILLCLSAIPVRGQAQPALAMRESRYLFLDLAEIDRMEGLAQAVNPGEKSAINPILEGTPGEWDHPRVKFYGTVIFYPETGLWRMWYSGTNDWPAGLSMTGPTDTRHIGYAESRDGLHWEKPKLGVIDFMGSKQNNLVIFDGQAASVFDLEREKVPGVKKRYRMYVESFGGSPRGSDNLHWFGSDDGYHWDEEGSISDKDLPIELAHVIYDPDDPNPERRWKAYSLLMDMDFPARKLGVCTSPDGHRWSDPIVVLDPRDGMEDENHYFGVTKYSGYYIALYDFMYRNHSTATELAVSRDGIHFTRVLNGQKVLPRGKKGDFDSSMPVVGHGFITVRGKHYLYYTGSDRNYQEGSSRSGLGLPWRRSLGLATWRQDGFTDLRVAEGRQDGWASTKEISVHEPGQYELWVNASVPDPENSLAVELLDGNSGKPLPEYGRADVLSGVDSLSRVVIWQGSGDLSKIAVPSVRLRFTLKGGEARLYSFGFRRKDGAHESR